MKNQGRVSALATIILAVVLVSCNQYYKKLAMPGNIKGVVTDVSGTLRLDMVRVTSEPFTGVRYSDALGRFEFSSLEYSSYRIVAEKKGYLTANTEVAVEPGRTTDIIIILKPE
jgi:hypothetical protein